MMTPCDDSMLVKADGFWVLKWMNVLLFSMTTQML